MINNEDYLYRFSGIARVYGMDALKRFSDSHILIVGLGGVGTWLAESLVRSGIGSITLLDMDDICISNTNRQLHATTENVGKSKVEVMKERLLSINPFCNVTAIHDFLTRKTVDKYITKDFDYIVDAFDSLTNKCVLIDQAVKLNQKVLTIGGAGGKTDPTMIEVKDLNKSYNDTLLYSVRKKLRQKFEFHRFKNKPYHVDSVFSPEEEIYPTDDGGITLVKPKDKNYKLDCETGLGTSTMVTGSMAYVASSFILRKIAND